MWLALNSSTGFGSGVLRVVLGLQLFIRDLGHRDAFDKAGGKERAALVLQAQFHRGVMSSAATSASTCCCTSCSSIPSNRICGGSSWYCAGSMERIATRWPTVMSLPFTVARTVSAPTSIAVSVLRGSGRAESATMAGAGKKLLHREFLHDLAPRQHAEGPR
jgi:hypothetical protein